MHQLHAIVSGKVQGVGYRDFVCREARALGLTGWVKNLDGGTVEVVAQGDKGQLETLVEKLTYGPRMSNVKQVDARWVEVLHRLQIFEIR